jgi:hypothetical protein
MDGSTLVFYPMSDHISGMCIRIDSHDSLIAINSRLTYGRQRFTAAHELYHLYFQENFQNVVCPKNLEGKKDPEERNADTFASFFLAPYDALKIYISEKLQKNPGQIEAADVVKIEQHFRISRQATLIRLQIEKFISADFANSLKTHVISLAIKLGYDDRLYLPAPEEKQFFTTGDYIHLAEKLKEKDTISHGKYEEYLLDAFRSDIVYNTTADHDEYVD